jgi:hypothetical protein
LRQIYWTTWSWRPKSRKKKKNYLRCVHNVCLGIISARRLVLVIRFIDILFIESYIHNNNNNNNNNISLARSYSRRCKQYRENLLPLFHEYFIRYYSRNYFIRAFPRYLCTFSSGNENVHSIPASHTHCGSVVNEDSSDWCKNKSTHSAESKTKFDNNNHLCNVLTLTLN